MSTESVNLPVVAGGAGAGSLTSQLQGEKTIIVSGLQGTINVQAKIGSAGWCTVASFSGSNQSQDKVIKVVADEMRVDATSGDAASVEVVAERASTSSVDVPAPPSSGAGASVDASGLGSLMTIEVADFQGQGSINIEASGDGASWGTIASFQGNGCETLEVSAKFLRAVGNGASGTIAAAAEDPAITSGPLHIVFRPEATGDDAPGGNVYTDFAEAFAAAKAATVFGTVEFEWDSRFSTHLNGLGATACILPAGAWDWEGIVWYFKQQNVPNYSLPGSGNSNVDVMDGSVNTNLTAITGPGPGVVSYDGPTDDAFLVNYLEVGTNVSFTNTVVGAGAMFTNAGGTAVIGFGKQNVYGGMGHAVQTLAVEPVIRATAFFAVLAHAGVIAKNCSKGTGFFFQARSSDSDGQDIGAAGVFQQDQLVLDGGFTASSPR